MDKELKYILIGILTFILFFIFRPVFYMAIFYLIIFFLYLQFNKRLKKKIVFLDSILIYSFVIIPLLSLIEWFSFPSLINFAINKSLEHTASSFWNGLVDCLANFVVNLHSYVFLILLSAVILVTVFKVINILVSLKRKEYIWVVFMIILFPMEIIYYFLVGRKYMKQN